MLNYNIVLENSNVLLRPIKSVDFYSFKEITNEQKLWYYFASDLSNLEELKNWVETAVNDLQNKTRIPFTIIYKPENRIIGSTSFGNFSQRDLRIEIGWTWISKEFQGKRINDQVKFLMLKYCFEDLNLSRVEFKTDVLNVHARIALKRIGAVEEGILRSHMLMTNNRRRDSIYFSVLKDEWQKLKELSLKFGEIK
ncbi:MAG: GNAT family N-acetyltransferase [Ignavibacteriae bacterium]|nr:GNAT family N-acetyltransferase [Ignavibacteriota bacterium]